MSETHEAFAAMCNRDMKHDWPAPDSHHNSYTTYEVKFDRKLQNMVWIRDTGWCWCTIIAMNSQTTIHTHTLKGIDVRGQKAHKATCRKSNKLSWKWAIRHDNDNKQTNKQTKRQELIILPMFAIVLWQISKPGKKEGQPVDKISRCCCCSLLYSIYFSLYFYCINY